jgi:hypothetical protein
MKNQKSVALLLHLHRQKSPSYFSPSSHEVMEEYLAHLYGYSSSTTSTVLSTIISPISIWDTNIQWSQYSVWMIAASYHNLF